MVTYSSFRIQNKIQYFKNFHLRTEHFHTLDSTTQIQIPHTHERWPFKMIAMFPKGVASLQGESFIEQTAKCVLSNEAVVPLSPSLFSALLVHSGHQEHVCFLLSLYRSSPVFPFLALLLFLPFFCTLF